jgi:MIP family channel proteins
MRGGLMKAGMAEALGVFFLVFVGGASICMDQYLTAMNKPGFGLLGIALAHGFALMVAVYMAAGKSGAHINPAVTIGLWAIGKAKANQAMTYILMQLAGATVGGLALFGMFSTMRTAAPYLGTPSYVSDVNFPEALSMPKAIGIEMMLTFLLMTVVLNTAVDAGRVARQMFGLCIGMTVTFGVLIGGPYTGAAMNPSRYFGPAVVSGQVSQLVVYFVGPILGALVAALFYKFCMEQKEESAAEAA